MPSGPPTKLKFLGANIQRRRRRLGFTQETLAEKAGLDPRYIRTLESPRANPRVAVLIAVLGVSHTPASLLTAFQHGWETIAGIAFVAALSATFLVRRSAPAVVAEPVQSS